ncbi:MAG: hypothetical protein KAI99_06375 [Cyclobacteriaceae bacterium]|nr:hypothetical protein [Cyclobacteriaceae bacterium]
MKKQLSNIAHRKARFIWYGLVLTLSFCTTLVVFNRNTNSNDRSYQTFELLKDSLLTQSQLIERPGLFSTWMNVVQQKQLLEVFQNKDSLTNQDKQLIQQIDQKLNTMLHERN